MWWFRSFAYFCLATAVGGGFFLMSAPAQQPAPAPKTNKVPPPPPPPKADTTAEKSLDKAIEEAAPKKLGAYSTDIWQRLDEGGMSFEAQGRYLAAPDYRLRLELKVQIGGSEGESLVVSDGRTVWNAMRIGTNDRIVTKWDLRQVQQQLRLPGTLPIIEEGFYPTEALSGVQPLLQGLRAQLTFTKQEPTTWKGHDVYLLTGVWKAEIQKLLTPQAQPWPAYLSRECKLYLDKTTYWPYRLEWWGPLAPRGASALLVQMEFRNPRRAEAEPGTFTFVPGEKEEVRDITKDKIEKVRQARSRQSSLTKPPSLQGPPTPPK